VAGVVPLVLEFLSILPQRWALLAHFSALALTLVAGLWLLAILLRRFVQHEHQLQRHARGIRRRLTRGSS
jgi:hypothetical protein